MTSKSKFFIRIYHNGIRSITPISNIRKKDANFFLKNNIMVSVEELGGDIVTYATPWEDRSEELEVIVFSQGRNAKETFAELAESAREAIASGLWKDFV